MAGTLVAPLLPLVTQIAEAATITPTRVPAAIAKALTTGEPNVGSGFVTSAAFDSIPPNGNPTATSTFLNTDFPSDGGSFAILSTGDATHADDAPQSGFASASDGGGNVRGNSDFDVTVLRLGVTVPALANCLQIDFQFLSEEFPEYKGSAFNDAFIAELDPTTPWTTSGSTINAPDNFAFDEDGNEISVNSVGETRVTAGQAADTIYDGATAPLVASKGIPPSEVATSHTLFLSLFDQGDSIFDSAVFLDGLRVGKAGSGGCTSGARRQISGLSMSATPESTATGIVDAPLGDVPMTGVSQHTDSSDIVTAPFGKAPFGKAPFGKAPFGKAPFGKAPFGKAPFGKAPFGKAPFGKAPFGKAPFGKAALSEYPLLRDGGWPVVLSHTCAYTQATPQSVTWQQLFADRHPTTGNICAPEIDPSSTDAITLDEILIGASPLANLPLLAYLLGNETWNEVSRPEGGTWADDFSTNPTWACSAVNPAESVYEGVANGCELDLTTLPNHTIGNLTNPTATAFWGLTISELNVKGSFLGAVPLSAIDNQANVVDCPNAWFDCGTGTLRDVAESAELDPAGVGAWHVDGSGEATGTFSDLGSAINGTSPTDPKTVTLSDLVIAFLDPTAVPIEDTPLTEFGFERLRSENDPTNFITYNVPSPAALEAEPPVPLSVQCLDSAGLKIYATLPPEFVVSPGTSQMSTNGVDYTTIADPTLGEGELTWQLSASGVPCAEGEIGAVNVYLRFDAMPGFTLGTFRSDVGAESTKAPRVNVTDTAPVEVTDSSEPDTIGIGDDSIFVGHLNAEGDVDAYSFTVEAGDSLQVSLSHLSRDYQLVLYAPDGSDVAQSLRPSTLARELPVGTEPQVDPTGTNIGVLPPPALQDIPFVDGKVLSGISDFRGTDPEFLSTVGVAGPAPLSDTTYVAQVSGANAAHGNEPYVLTVRTFDPIELPMGTQVTLLDPTAPSSGVTTMPTVTSNDHTLILFDYQRTAQVYGTAAAGDIQTSLDALVSANLNGMNAVIVPLDADPDVGNAFANWDADPANPQEMDDVVRAINDVVDNLGDLSGLKNIVIIGDGSVIPHAAIPDGTADGNEQGFVGDTIFGGEINYLTGALANGYFLSDAPYGALVPLSIKGQFVYLPQVAVGRLGGTVNASQNDIRDALDRFVASDGMADPRTADTEPRTAFESDYDWFADGGDLIANALTGQVDQLERLSPNATSPNATWSRQHFADAFAGTSFSTLAPAHVISPNGHFDQYRMLPAEGAATNDPSDVYSTADLPSGGGISATIIGFKANVNGDDDANGDDDSNAFYGDTSIIDGMLDCNAWGSVANAGTAGDGAINASDNCTLIGYDGTSSGVTISVVSGAFQTSDGALPTVFNAPGGANGGPDNPDIGDSDFAWSVVDGRVDSNGDETIDGEDCHFGIVGDADVLGSDGLCGFASTIDASLNGLVDLNSDEAITSADTCLDGCFFGHNVVEGEVGSFLAGRIIFSIGCHFGTDFPDLLPGATPGDPRLDDWAQALAGRGNAVQIGNYGYGIGDTATAGFQEIILGDFAAGLDPSQSVGQSLLDAQQSYFASMPSFTPYDLKVLQELATWGMPMYGVPDPTGPATLLSTSSSDPTFTSELSPVIPGLSEQTITINSDFDQETTSDGRVFFSNGGLTQATHPYPIVPKATADIPSTSGEVAHGALPLHWDPIQETNIASGGGYAFANATYDSSALEDAPAAKVVYPTTFGNVGTFYGIDGTAHQTLVVLTGQFRSGSGAPQFGTFRKFPSGDWLVLSSTNTTDFLPPQFTSVKVIDNGDGTSTIEVRVDDKNGVGRVLAQALRPGGSTGCETSLTPCYVAVELDQDGTDATLWTSMVDSPIEVTVFAADMNGNVGTANNGGPGFVPQPPETTDPKITIRTPAKPPEGKPLPMYPLSDRNTALADPPLSDFSCEDNSSSGILSCVDQDGNPSGTALDTSTLGIHTFTVTATDNDGHVTTLSRQYEVIKFSGFFTPINNPPTINTVKGGAGIAVKYRLQRLVNGQLVPIADPTSFVSITASQEGGATCQDVTDPIEITTGSSGLQYLGDGNWQFNWATKKTYSGKCFRMNLNLWDAHFKTDGVTPLGHAAAFALFKFK